MSGNLLPQHPKKLRWDFPNPTALLLKANTSSQGDGVINYISTGALYSVFLSNDSYIEYVRFKPTGTSFGTLTATIARIFLSTNYNNGGVSPTTSADTHLFAEVNLPLVTPDSGTDAQNPIDVPLGFRLPPLWNVLVSVHSAPAAGVAWQVEAFTTAADYI